MIDDHEQHLVRPDPPPGPGPGPHPFPLVAAVLLLSVAVAPLVLLGFGVRGLFVLGGACAGAVVVILIMRRIR